MKYYPEMLSHIENRFRKYQPDLLVDSNQLREVLDHIIRPGPETGSILNRGDLVSIPVMEVVDGSKVSMCGLRNQSEIVAREAVETFYREHLGDYATLDTAQSWREYASNLATLVDAKSRWDEAKSGISLVAAPQPPTKIKTEADVAALDSIVEQLELQAEGVSFVVGIHLPCYTIQLIHPVGRDIQGKTQHRWHLRSDGHWNNIRTEQEWSMGRITREYCTERKRLLDIGW